MNKTMKEMMTRLNVKHITMSPDHSHTISKVECFHYLFGDILPKLTGDILSWGTQSKLGLVLKSGTACSEIFSVIDN